MPPSERPAVDDDPLTPPLAATAHPNADPVAHPYAATGYAAGTGQQLKRAAITIAAILVIAFFIMFLVKLHAAHSLARDTSASAGTPALVDVVTVRNEAQGRPLTLPGETAVWYESLIYARVSGYVGTWSADIGDHVEMGQVLATIDTPELDADFLAARRSSLPPRRKSKSGMPRLRLPQAPMRAGAILPRAWYPTRNGKTKRPARHQAQRNWIRHAHK